MKRSDLIGLLREHGSRSIQYRRAWRNEYRRLNPRIDYAPNRAALAALERGWAASYTDAINQALSEWVRG